MANQIRIPVLMPRFAGLDLPALDTDHDPYAIIGASANAIRSAFDARDAAREKRDDADEPARVRSAEAEMQRFVSSEVARREEHGLVGPGFASQFDREYDERAHVEMARAKTARERHRLREAFARNRPYTLQLSMRAEAGVREGERSSNAGAALERLSRAAYHDPMNIGRYRADADQLMAALPPDEQKALAEERRRINETYLRGLIAKNPELALETLRDGAGAAEEELGISAELRRELAGEAERAVDAEQSAVEDERQGKALDAVVATRESGLRTYETPREGWRSYEPIYDVYDFDPGVARRLEAEADKSARQASAFVQTAGKIGRRIAAARPIEWGEPNVKALDVLWHGVAGEDVWADGVHHRMAGLARYAGRTPDAMRKHIRAGVRSGDASKRVAAGRLLCEMEHADMPKLFDWAPPDVRAFGQIFGALTEAGFADLAAVKRMDSGKVTKLEQQEARRRHFSRRFDGAAFLEILNVALGGGVDAV